VKINEEAAEENDEKMWQCIEKHIGQWQWRK